MKFVLFANLSHTILLSYLSLMNVQGAQIHPISSTKLAMRELGKLFDDRKLKEQKKAEENNAALRSSGSLHALTDTQHNMSTQYPSVPPSAAQSVASSEEPAVKKQSAKTILKEMSKWAPQGKRIALTSAT